MRGGWVELLTCVVIATLPLIGVLFFIWLARAVCWASDRLRSNRKAP